MAYIRVRTTHGKFNLMNGKPYPETIPTTAYPATDALPFLIALIVSCLLHAIALFLSLPSLGVAVDRANGSPVPHRYTVSLAAEKSLAVLAPPWPSGELAPLQPTDTAASAPHAVQEEDPLPVPPLGYFATHELTKRPQPVVLAELETKETQHVVASGRMVLRLWIDDRGGVADVAVIHSDLPDLFARTSIDAFKHSRFTPGERNGLRVGTVMDIEVSYDDNRVLAP